jgi:hypothetical protein
MTHLLPHVELDTWIPGPEPTLTVWDEGVAVGVYR